MQKGTIFKHRTTGNSACWLKPYIEGEFNAEDVVRVRSAEDLPDFNFELSDLYMPRVIYREQGKKGLYCYLRAFFCGYDEALADQDDFVLFLFPSGFPDPEQKLFITKSEAKL